LRDNPDDRREKGKPILQIAKPASQGFVGNLVMVGNVIYGADGSGTVFACNEKGRLLWRFTTENNPNRNSSPVYGGDKIFFSGGRELLVLDARDGKIIYRMQLPPAVEALSGRRALPLFLTAVGNFVALPSDTGIQLIDPASGKMSKEYAIPGRSRMSPTLFNGRLFIAKINGMVESINLYGTGIEPHPIQTSARDTEGIGITPFFSRGYFAGHNNMVVCIDFQTRTLLWERSIKASEAAQSDCAVNDTGVFILAGGKLFGFSHEGTELWTPLEGVSSPPLAVPGKLIIGLSDKTLQILDSRTGNTLKSLKLLSTITARPAMMERLIIVGTDTGELMIIDPEMM
jgi:outer membrane protein assembly factor BamB